MRWPILIRIDRRPRKPMPSTAASPIAAAAGGSFLLESRTPAEIFTPEDLNEEQRQIAATAEQFAREEILPRVAAIEAKEPGVMAGAAAQGRRAGIHRRRHSRRIRRPGHGQGQLHAGHRSHLGAGQLFHGIRRAHRHRARCRWCGTEPKSRSSATCPSSPPASGSALMRFLRPAPAPTP